MTSYTVGKIHKASQKKGIHSINSEKIFGIPTCYATQGLTLIPLMRAIVSKLQVAQPGYLNGPLIILVTISIP